MQEVFIVGNPGFLELHRKHLDDNSKFLRGHVSVQVTGKEVQLFWIHNKKELKQFKKAIGADLIWKYRLRFYFDLDGVTPKEEEKEEFSTSEKELMRKAILSLA